MGQRGDRVSASSRSGFPNPMVTRSLLDQPQDLVGVGRLGDDDRPACEQDRQHVHAGATGSEERRDRDRHVVAAEIDHREEVDDVPGDVAVRQHHPLRCPRGTRRVREHAHIVESDDLVDGIVAGLRDELLVVDVRRRVADRRPHGTPRPAEAERRAAVRSTTTTVGEYPISTSVMTASVEPMIDRRHDGTELRGREQDLEERRMVGAEPADTVSPLDAELAEPVREAANPVRELTVRAARLAVDQRGLIGRDSCSPLDPRPDSPVRSSPPRLPHLQPPQPRTPPAGFKARLAQDADPVTRTKRRLDPRSHERQNRRSVAWAHNAVAHHCSRQVCRSA